MRRVVAALAALSLALAGCGERDEVVNPGAPQPDRITLLLDFFANADHAPIYSAEANGHFEELGLDVKIRQPADPATPLKLLASGKVDLAISYEPEVLRARDKGLRVVSIAALVQEPLTSLMWLPSANIRSPAGPRGQARGNGGHRLPAGLPPVDPGRRQAWIPSRSRSRTWASSSAPRCSRGAWTPRSARSGTTRACSSSSATRTRRSCR